MTKREQIEALAAQGFGPEDIARRTGAHSSTISQVIGERRRPPLERAREWLAKPDFHARFTLEDSFRKAVLKETARRIEADADTGIQHAADLERLFRGQLRRATKRVRYRRCATVSAMSLGVGALQMLGQLDSAQDRIAANRLFSEGCPACLAEIDRADGWQGIYRFKASGDRRHARLARRLLDRSVESYEVLLSSGNSGHAVHGNGISSSLHARALIRAYEGRALQGLPDARRAVELLHPKRSPGLVLPVGYTYAYCNLKLKTPAGRIEAEAHFERLLKGRENDESPAFAKLLWARGLLARKPFQAEEHLIDAWNILFAKRMPVDCASLLADLLELHGLAGGVRSQECFLRRIFESHGRKLVIPAWLAPYLRSSELKDALHRIARFEALPIILSCLRHFREMAGEDVVPRPSFCFEF